MIIFFIVWSIWLVAEIILNRLLRSKENKEKDYDKGSIATIWRVIGVANTLAVVSAYFIKLPMSHHLLVPYTGLFMLGFGMLGRMYSIRMLGRMFTVNVNVSNNHRLVKTGIFKYIRHPAYLGVIISFVGFGLSLNNWLSLFIVSIAVSAVMIHRINIEEKALLEKFGAEYEVYQKSTYRLIPLIY
jgi:protein-S-isoprenylcysteine O-methyltransferase Ste14